MLWSDFVVIANNLLQREFKSLDDGLIYEYDKETQENTIIYKTKLILRKKLIWLFPNWSKSNEMFDSKYISTSEEKLFIFLLKIFPEYKIVETSKKPIKTYYWLEYDAWEKIPLKERKKLLKLVCALDDKSFCRYMNVESRDDAQGMLKILTIKLLHPQYYRLMQNIKYLDCILSEENEILSDTAKKDKIILFEKDFNNLLKKYEKLTDGFIAPYPITISEIDAYTAKNKEISKDIIHSEEDWVKQLEKLL